MKLPGNTFRKNVETVLFGLTLLVIVALGFSLGYVYRGLADKGASYEGVSVVVPPARPYMRPHGTGCMALSKGADGSPVYHATPCPIG